MVELNATGTTAEKTRNQPKTADRSTSSRNKTRDQPEEDERVISSTKETRIRSHGRDRTKSPRRSHSKSGKSERSRSRKSEKSLKKKSSRQGRSKSAEPGARDEEDIIDLEDSLAKHVIKERQASESPAPQKIDFYAAHASPPVATPAATAASPTGPPAGEDQVAGAKRRAVHQQAERTAAAVERLRAGKSHPKTR